jgi:hypothetical protein
VIAVEAGEPASGIVAKLQENARAPQSHEVRYRAGKRFVMGWAELPAFQAAEV